ncbi:MAG: response regulator [Bacteroidota bacterium]|nr:response regulator [Bacteroidota bacterium]
MTQKILIIDDEPDIRFLLKRSLVSHHFTVEEAENLKEGLQKAADSVPDIIILDVNLPDGNGIQFACRFKTENNILILISADNDQLTKEFENYCASGFLRKPFTPSDLISLITQIQEKRKLMSNISLNIKTTSNG